MSTTTYVIAGAGVCVIIFIGYLITINRMMKPAMAVYETLDQREPVKGRVSGIMDEQSYGMRIRKKNNQNETAYPIYKAKINGKFVESPGFVRYRKEDLERKIKTGETVQLYYDKAGHRLWNADEIPRRGRQMMVQMAVMMAAFVFVCVVLPLIVRG